MREILKELMRGNGDNQGTLAKKSGVTQPTIQRFLSGKHGDPSSKTVRKLASSYGLSESQLRGDLPINNLAEGKETKTNVESFDPNTEDKERDVELLKLLKTDFASFSANKLNMLRQATEIPEDEVDDSKKIIYVFTAKGNKKEKKQ